MMNEKPTRKPYVYAPKDEPGKRAQPIGKHEKTSKKLISQMIDKYVGIEEKRAQTLRDATRAWEEYRGRGLRATSREVLAWLERWNEEDESEGPICHR